MACTDDAFAAAALQHLHSSYKSTAELTSVAIRKLYLAQVKDGVLRVVHCARCKVLQVVGSGCVASVSCCDSYFCAHCAVQIVASTSSHVTSPSARNAMDPRDPPQQLEEADADLARMLSSMSEAEVAGFMLLVSKLFCCPHCGMCSVLEFGTLHSGALAHCSLARHYASLFYSPLKNAEREERFRNLLRETAWEVVAQCSPFTQVPESVRKAMINVTFAESGVGEIAVSVDEPLTHALRSYCSVKHHYENQRCALFGKYSARRLMHADVRGPYSDESDDPISDFKTSFPLGNHRFRWVGDWSADMSLWRHVEAPQIISADNRDEGSPFQPPQCDENGWQYAFNWPKSGFLIGGLLSWWPSDAAGRWVRHRRMKRTNISFTAPLLYSVYESAVLDVAPDRKEANETTDGEFVVVAGGW